jgi:uncharacterized protein
MKSGSPGWMPMETEDSPTDSIRVGPRCPRCETPVVWSDNPARPFCSHRCKLIDLGSWLDEEYRVPGPPIPSEPADGERHPADE